MKTFNIGILGLGKIGGGAYTIITQNRDLIAERCGAAIEVCRILDVCKKPDVPEYLYTEDPDDVLNCEDIDLVIETLGGIEPATSYMLQAMRNGKHVVTANKAAIAANYELLMRTARENNVRFLFEASVGGGIPILTSMQNALQANHFLEIKGILNGTTNYILTRMTEDDMDYSQALREAQMRGFAEANPSADVEGIDVANKLTILIALAFGQYIAPADIPTAGISDVTRENIQDAAADGCKVKLIAQASCGSDGTITARIAPEKIPADHPLASVNNEFNAIYITGDMVGELMFYGKGAGPLPTGSAIVGDIISIIREQED